MIFLRNTEKEVIMKIINKGDLPFYLRWALIAAIVYCIPVFFFLRTPEFREVWLFYLGSAFFMVVIAWSLLALNRRYGGNGTTRTLITSGHVITVFAIVIAFVFCVILTLFMVPQLYRNGPGNIVEGKPANLDNIVFLLLVSITVINFAAGSIPSIILPQTMKRNQTTERGENVSKPLI